MVEIGEAALWFTVVGWIFALLWGFFIVAWRARELVVKYLESARAERLYEAISSRVTKRLENDVRTVIDGRLKSLEVEIAAIRGLGVKLEATAALLKSVESLEPTLAKSLEAMGDAIVLRLDSEMATFKSEAMAELKRKYSGMEKGADQMAETAAEMIAAESANLSMQEQMALKLASLPVPKHWSPAAQYGAELARQLALRKMQEFKANQGQGPRQDSSASRSRSREPTYYSTNL